ncbi:MAG: bifunctional 3-demethylubiquinol 3-O-methyltransferase/2-polyprenyl-6-hydroxyphenol methylase, partial [Caulobacterales bacterium]
GGGGAPGGFMTVPTNTPTLRGLARALVGAYFGRGGGRAAPHDWRRFLRPEEIRGFLAGEALEVSGPFGVAFDPLSGRWSRSADAEVNYLMTIAAPSG